MLERYPRPHGIVVWAILTGLLTACGGSDPATPEDPCELQALPFSGSAAGPVVQQVTLELQPSGLVVLATAIDPQGSDDLTNVVQTVAVYPDASCVGAPLPITDDLACSDCEESFGTLVSSSEPLYAAVAAAESWPVSVTFSDASGNVTAGNVSARVVR